MRAKFKIDDYVQTHWNTTKFKICEIHFKKDSPVKYTLIDKNINFIVPNVSEEDLQIAHDFKFELGQKVFGYDVKGKLHYLIVRSRDHDDDININFYRCAPTHDWYEESSLFSSEKELKDHFNAKIKELLKDEEYD